MSEMAAVAKFSEEMPELYYWPARGRGEQIRLCLAAGDVEWVDKNFSFADGDAAREAFFAACREMGGNSTTNVPMLKVDGVFYTQSSAVLRLVARKVGLMPTSPEHQYQCDNLISAVDDYRSVAYKPLPMFGGGEAQKKQYVEVDMPKHLGNLERLLEGDHFVGDALTVADITVYDGLSTMAVQLVPGCLDAFPKLKAFFEKVKEVPGIAKWQGSPEHAKLMAFGAL